LLLLLLKRESDLEAMLKLHLKVSALSILTQSL
jgi:hypothetical protein